jgi:hypothetical protein
MEESVWLYFGVLIVIISIAIITSVFIHYDQTATEQRFADDLEQLGRQIAFVCKAPKDTKLTAIVTVPAGAVLYAEDDRICMQLKDQIRCEASACPLEKEVLLNLTNTTLFKAHEYRCNVLHAGKLNISCQG